MMDAFEGIHTVHISSSPPSSSSSSSLGRGYEVLSAGNAGIAVYSSMSFFSRMTAMEEPTGRRQTAGEGEGERCAVGR